MSGKNRSMFADGFTERRDLEQYFWTEETVHRLMKALEYEEIGTICCLSSPSLSHAFHVEQERAETLLDIDTRFEYLPKFRYFDIRAPTTAEGENNRIVVFDPPFFYISMEQLFEAVATICERNFKTKLLIGFLKREEETLLKHFKPLNLNELIFFWNMRRLNQTNGQTMHCIPMLIYLVLSEIKNKVMINSFEKKLQLTNMKLLNPFISFIHYIWYSLILLT